MLCDVNIRSLKHLALLTLTVEATSSGSCTSRPSLQVYKQSITFLFSSLPERIISPARFPRKNWAIRAFPPGYVTVEMRGRKQLHTQKEVTQVYLTQTLPFSGMTSQACRLNAQSQCEWRSCMLVCVPSGSWSKTKNDGWIYTCIRHMQHLH